MLRSQNSAFKVGADVGRRVEDVWVPDHVLARMVDRELLPQIQLRRQDTTAEDGAMGFAVAMIVTSVAFGAIAVVELVPGLSWSQYVSFIPWGIAVLAAAVAVAASIAAFIAAARIRGDAEAVRQAEIQSLRTAALAGATQSLERRRLKHGMLLSRDTYLPSTRPRPRPSLSPREAEELAAEWMRYLGDESAQVTDYVGDGGIDVVGARSLAQVKHYSGTVGVAAIRELAGVCGIDGRRGLFFTSTGYARGAVEFADQARIALFVYHAGRGDLEAMNPLAKTLVARGL